MMATTSVCADFDTLEAEHVKIQCEQVLGNSRRFDHSVILRTSEDVRVAARLLESGTPGRELFLFVSCFGTSLPGSLTQAETDFEDQVAIYWPDLPSILRPAVLATLRCMGSGQMLLKASRHIRDIRGHAGADASSAHYIPLFIVVKDEKPAVWLLRLCAR